MYYFYKEIAYGYCKETRLTVIQLNLRHYYQRNCNNVGCISALIQRRRHVYIECVTT